MDCPAAHTLAILILWSIGLVGIARGLDRLLQANTERRKRVFSTFFIGCGLVNHLLLCTLVGLNLALSDFRSTVFRNALADT